MHFTGTKSSPWILLLLKYKKCSARMELGKVGHQVNLDTRLQTVEIQMRRLLMSCLIRIFTVCLVNLYFRSIIEL